MPLSFIVYQYIIGLNYKKKNNRKFLGKVSQGQEFGAGGVFQ